MSNFHINVLLLAAGQGSRLHPLIKGEHPKCLTPIFSNETYLDLQLSAWARCKIDSATFIGGFEFEILKQHLDTVTTPFPKYFTYNAEFLLGSVLSLKSACSVVQDSFFLFNGDHYYSDETYKKIFSQVEQTQICLFVDRDRLMSGDDMKVYAPEGVFHEMHKTLTDYHWGYVGVSFIPQQCLKNYWSALNDVIAQTEGKGSVEAVINRYVERFKEPIKLIDISGSWWTEIDTPEDYEKARLTLTKHREMAEI